MENLKNAFPAIVAAENPLDACQKELRSLKARYARISCSREAGRWYEAQIDALETLLCELRKEG